MPKREVFEPRGFQFFDIKQGQMILVEEGPYKGWLCYRHPDGQWVTLREATKLDLEVIEKMKKAKVKIDEEFVRWANGEE